MKKLGKKTSSKVAGRATTRVQCEVAGCGNYATKMFHSLNRRTREYASKHIAVCDLHSRKDDPQWEECFCTVLSGESFPKKD